MSDDNGQIRRTSFEITLLPGDGIGPEVVRAAAGVLDAVAERFGHAFTYTERPMGGAAIDAEDDPFPQSTLEACRSADAVLLGAVGGPKWDGLPAAKRPEKGLLRMRSALGLFCNLRPAVVFPSLAERSPLRADLAPRLDLMVVRELTGGSYFGDRTEAEGAGPLVRAIDTCPYSVQEIERVARIGFEQAQQRGGRLTSVDKANVLATSRLWRRTVDRLAPEYPDVTVEHGLVDSVAMRLVAQPDAYTTILTENLFGDILSDLAAGLTGTLGLAPSASLGDGTGPGVFEPVHGSAPDIAGQDRANPMAAILSAAMLLRDGLGLLAEAEAVEHAVRGCLESGCITADLGGSATTSEVGRAVAEAILGGDSGS